MAAAARLYPAGGRPRLATTWLVGITAAVAVRAAIVGHFSAAFYGVALGFTAVFLAVARLLGRRVLNAA